METPLFKTIFELALCIVPKIMEVGLDSATIITSIFTGSFMVSFLKSTPSLFKTIIGSIKKIYAARKKFKGKKEEISNDASKTQAQKDIDIKNIDIVQFKEFGLQAGKIFLALFKAVIGKAPKCAKDKKANTKDQPTPPPAK